MHRHFPTCAPNWSPQTQEQEISCVRAKLAPDATLSHCPAFHKTGNCGGMHSESLRPAEVQVGTRKISGGRLKASKCFIMAPRKRKWLRAPLVCACRDFLSGRPSRVAEPRRTKHVKDGTGVGLSNSQEGRQLSGHRLARLCRCLDSRQTCPLLHCK